MCYEGRRRLRTLAGGDPPAGGDGALTWHLHDLVDLVREAVFRDEAGADAYVSGGNERGEDRLVR